MNRIMTLPDDALRKSLRHAVYWLLIVTSLGAAVGRIWTVRSELGQTPLLSANDRSRWATIRALVDHGTYQIDHVIYSDYSRKRRDREWYTIDLVRHQGHDGMEHYYSSKPPLLPTLLAVPYWVIKHTLGVNFRDHPFYVVRLMLVLVNVLPLGVYFVLLARLIERYGRTDWGRLFVMAAATYGTFLTTFAVTLNNHLPAAISVLIVLHAAVPIWCRERRSWWRFGVAGLFAAFAVANELPALSFFAAVALALSIRSPIRTLSAFAPAVAVVAAAFFVTNFWAHDSWRPPYAHRSDGPVIGVIDDAFADALDAGEVPSVLLGDGSPIPVPISSQAVVADKTGKGRWVIWDRDGHDRLAIVRRGNSLEVRRWDNWYEYAGSYWTSGKKTGVDLGEPSRGLYALHILVGHHGVFSLTPLWIISVAGAILWLTGRRNGRIDPPWWRLNGVRGVAALTLALSLVCVAFYIARPLEDRNYGGVASGFRWLFWLIPLWLLVMLPAADRMAGSRPWRVLGYATLAISAVTAGYASLDPWNHPWIYQYWSYLGWKT